MKNSNQLTTIEAFTKYLGIMTNAELETLEASIVINELPAFDEATFTKWSTLLAAKELELKNFTTVSPY